MFKHLGSLFPYLWRYRWRLLLGVCFTALSNLFGVFSPQVIREAINRTIALVPHHAPYVPDPAFRKLFNLIGTGVLSFTLLILAFAVLRGLFLFFMRQTLIVMSRYIEYDQKADLYRHYQELHLGFYKQNNTGDLMNRMTDDVSKVRMFTGPTLMYTINLLSLFVIVLYTMYRVNPMLTLFSVLPLPLMGLTIFLVNHIIERKSEQIQQQLSALTTFVQESFSGIRLIKSYVQESQMLNFFSRETGLYKEKNLSLAKVESIYFPIIFLLVGLSNVLTIFVGGTLAIQGKISPGNIAEFVLYINMLTWPIASVGWVMALMQRAAASQKRINEFMHIPPAISSAPGGLRTQLQGAISFRQVSFSYPDTGITALKNVSFDLQPGQKLAVIGRVGSGKSTLAQLLVRAYEASAGEILLDNQPIQSYALKTLRGQIGYVPQDVFLFSDTVRHNIGFGLDHPVNSELEAAAGGASVAAEILRLPLGYDSVIGERGVTLSGGQKQRISLARALAKKPPILLLDDCLSAVDAHTEQQILQHLGTELENRTAIIITHRIFSLLHFDQIVVLDDGEVVENGTHEALMAGKGAYYNLYQLQQLEGAANEN